MIKTHMLYRKLFIAQLIDVDTVKSFFDDANADAVD